MREKRKLPYQAYSTSDNQQKNMKLTKLVVRVGISTIPKGVLFLNNRRLFESPRCYYMCQPPALIGVH